MTSNLSFVLAATTSSSTKALSKTTTTKSNLNSVLLTPEFSRLPPDGHEFPPNFQEVNGNFPSSGDKMSNSFSENSTDHPKHTQKSTPTAVVAPLVPRKTSRTADLYEKLNESSEIKSLTASKPPTSARKLSNWRTKDEKSEKSVKDKIAMFSNSSTDISQFLPKTPFKDTTPAKKKVGLTKSIENIYSSPSLHYTNGNGMNGSMKKKAMSVENLDDFDGVEVQKKTMTMSPALDKKYATLSSKNRAQSVENLSEPVKSSYESATLPRSKPESLNISRRISFSGYTNSQIEERRKSSMSNLLESRKKSISKLRGLVIPEKVPENELQPEQKVFGLPVIRSKDTERIGLFNRSISSPGIKTHVPSSVNSGHKKSFDDKFLVPETRKKYSRESGICMLSKTSPAPVPPLKPPRTSLILLKSAVTDESDTDSVLSSRVSTPPISPVQKTPTPLVRTFSSETNTSISSNSTLTSGSGSQASCSSVGSTTPTVDLSRKMSNKSSENLASRKSVLASSKNRSGRDNYEQNWRDEDSTDGGIDNDDRRRTPKAKARTSIVNYKVVGSADNIVDKVINVATYVEVLTSDSDDRSDIHEPVTESRKNSEKLNLTKTSSKSYKEEPSVLSDMAKWVRSESSKSILEANKSSKEIPEPKTHTRSTEPVKKLNLSEIRKTFENKSPQILSPVRTPKEKIAPNHNRFSSWDSVASSSSGVSSELLGTGTGTTTNTSESLQTLQSDFGSFSSFGSSHSLITQQDIQLIIEEADPPLQTPDAFVVVLQRETPESSVGITLAGGSDYEAKEITIHKILTNFPADKDGRLRRGDRILSINGLSMRGLTHRESLSVLKAPRPDVVMVVTRSKSVVKTSPMSKRSSVGSLSSLVEKSDSNDMEETNLKNLYNASRSLDLLDTACDEEKITLKVRGNLMNKNMEKTTKESKSEKGAIESIEIVKDGAGLGFSIDGGYDSPKGNLPLLIKKIFMGGAAEKSSNLKVGDEILEINDKKVDKMTRIDVWNMMKQLPQGDPVKLLIKKM